MIDINKIEAAAKAASGFAWDDCAGHIVSQDAVLEMVSMIRERDAVLRQVLTLLGPEAPECSGCAAEWGMAIAAIKEILT